MGCSGVLRRHGRTKDHAIHGIVIPQGPRTTRSSEHASRTLHGVDFINIAPLRKDGSTARFYRQRQFNSPLRTVHCLANHMKKRIPGYIPYWSETSVYSGNQMPLAAKQRNCPTAVAAKWTNRNDNLCNHAVTSCRSRIQRSPYITLPCNSHSRLNCANDKDSILPFLAAHLDVGTIFDLADWTDPNQAGQSLLLSLGFWHGQPCIILGIDGSPAQLT
jgi:hypothetical protein